MDAFDPLNMPGNYVETYSSTSSSTPPKALADEEIALRLVEMHVRNARSSTIQSIVDNYFFVLNKLKNKPAETTQPDEAPQQAYETSESSERDMISDREYMSDSDVDAINPSEIL